MSVGMQGDLQFRVYKNLQTFRYEIRGRIVGKDGMVHGHFMPALATSVENAEGSVLPPMLSLDADAAKNLMDELWVEGIRPTNHADNEGELKAVRLHLEDMRRIVMDLMELKK